MVQLRRFQHHFESSAAIAAPAAAVFAFIDDPARLASHMTKPSWMMGGGRMGVKLDAGKGQRVGSRIVMMGRAFGMDLELEEVIDERTPPLRKTWHRTGTPRLVVIGAYRMGCELADEDAATRLRVFIDYDLPPGAAWLRAPLGTSYARWCTERMLEDTRAHFAGDVSRGG